ncbi:glycosyltransferase [Metabacillus elymi]|uniref:Glycosyltransferase n=1 Tax=Metabacillus elymi TaxID=2745198 RepID=A0ABX6RX52_9BACI|nr:glycosyltransferase [Metabacillus sp. KUDC1714]QNF26187.1 glycosyltransferase [Metabacillus sp. KUDC1714]
MSKISVIVPVYNVDEFLPNCISSILEQTYKDIELILINDGSTDKSGEICNEFAEKDDRVKVLHNKNSGPSSARNAGIKLAQGEFIAFVDADDTIEPNMYEILLKHSLEHNADIVVCPFKTINLVNNTEAISSIMKDANIIFDKHKIEKQIIPSILNNKTYSLMPIFNKLYKKSLFYSNNIKFDTEKSHSEDARLNFTLLTIINNLVYIEQPLYNYFIRERDSLTNKIRSDLHIYAFDNKNFLIALSKKYSLDRYINNIREHFSRVVLSYLQEIVNSDLSQNQKYKIISDILGNEEFKSDLNYIKTSSLYLNLLKIICNIKNEKICLYFIKFKLKLQFFINKAS